MKKVLALGSATIGFLSMATKALAQVAPPPPIKITVPPQGIRPDTPLGTIISNAIKITFVVAIILVLVMVVMGAVSWITSGGDKEAIASARKRIINALIGLALLALAFLIVNVAGSILNIQILGTIAVPSLQSQ